MKRVAIYVKYPFEGKLIDKEVEELKTFALNKKDWIIKDVFVDIDNYNEINKGLEFDKLFTKIEKYEYDILLVARLSDLTPSTKVYLAMAETINDYEVTIYSKEFDCEINLGDILDKKLPDSVFKTISKKRTNEEKVNDRLAEMKFSFETLHLMRCTLSDNIVQEENHEHLLEAYDFINDTEKKIWKYVAGEKKDEES